MSRLDDFLAHHVEKYLFYDIRFMEQDDANGGGVGYPMLMTCCAGIELLGALRSTSRFQTHGCGDKYFADYWQNCLYPPPSRFAGHHARVYQLVRHGIAHLFFTKGNIGVVRKQPTLHFMSDRSGLFLIDAVQFGRDLIDSYTRAVKPILSDPARLAEKAGMEARLAEMESEFGSQATRHAGASAPNAHLGATGPTTQSAASASSRPGGALGPTGPIGPSGSVP
jgi:hypothetical protein